MIVLIVVVLVVVVVVEILVPSVVFIVLRRTPVPVGSKTTNTIS